MPATLTPEITALTDTLEITEAATRHLNFAWQDAALALREQGHTYPEIRDLLGFTGRGTGARTAHHATMHAVNTAAVRRDGTNTAAVSYRHHRTTNERRFGIEIEFDHASSNDVYSIAAQRVRAAIVTDLIIKGIDARIEGYNHDTQTWWKMTTDCTVTGGEIVSPIMNGTADAHNEVREIIRSVKAAGGKTRGGVGMHVHHDVTDFNGEQMARLVKNLRFTQDALARFVPRSRTTGELSHSAALLSSYSFDRLDRQVAEGALLPARARTRANRVGACGVSRASFFNLNSVLTYGTVEFRGLGYTLNPIKIRAWVEIGQVLVAASRRGLALTENQTPETLIEALRNEGLSAKSAAKFLAVTAAR